ncbi:MAG: hypothetical protein H8E55_66745 [Pelagibacterales bacterium]|nr:hypothetical protein [Pelagibacterales bacterium]
MVRVKCILVDSVHIHYECPYCWTVGHKIKASPYKKNGYPYVYAHPTIHRHGSNRGKIGYGIQHRTSHCTVNNESVEICIDETTEMPIEHSVGLVLTFD